MMLISLQEAKEHLYIDHDHDDNYLIAQISASSGAVLNYIKDFPIGQPERDEQGRIITDSNGEPIYMYDSNGIIVRFEIKAAVKILLGELYKNREAEQQGAVPSSWGYGYLPQPVIALLYPFRTPSFA